MRFFLLLLAFFSIPSMWGQGIQGFWKTIDDKTGMQQSIIAIYPYNNKFYGRIVATYDENGQVKETLETPSERAPGVKGNPYYVGMDIIWNLQKTSNKYSNGKILDPEHGNVYNVEMWPRNGNLIVRGKILCFGRNQTWLPASDQDFSPYSKPDIAQFVPRIPQVK